MKFFKIIVHLQGNNFNDGLEDAIDCYCSIMRNSKQIINDENFIKNTGESLEVEVLCPAEDSLDDKYNSKYTAFWKNRIEEICGQPIQYKRSGNWYIDWDYKVPENPTGYILKGDNYISPLRSLDNFEPVPLYKIPYTGRDGHSFDDIRSWTFAYESMKSLWWGIYERFATKQLQDCNSKLNKSGREIAATIERLTEKPTYYFLFNDRNKKAEKKNNHCPQCGNDWKLKESLHNTIDYKCDDCRLVSEISGNT